MLQIIAYILFFVLSLTISFLYTPCVALGIFVSDFIKFKLDKNKIFFSRVVSFTISALMLFLLTISSIKIGTTLI